MPLQRERNNAGQEIDEHETDEEYERALHVGCRVELRQMHEVYERSAVQHERTEKEQINHGREQRQQKLKQKHIGKRNPSQSSILRPSQGIAMFPECLKRS